MDVMTIGQSIIGSFYSIQVVTSGSVGRSASGRVARFEMERVQEPILFGSIEPGK